MARLELGKADLEFSRRLLTNVFRTRDWYANARRPMILAGEFPDGFDTDGPGKNKHDAYWHMFNNRFKPVQESCVELQSLKCEAEALWGPEVVTCIERLLKCCRSLQSAMEVTLNIYAASGPPDKLEQSARQFEKQLYDFGREITVDGREGAENSFTVAMKFAVDAIEQHVRGKLMQKPTVRNVDAKPKPSNV